MRFAIRDDDICYHTKAEDVELLYGDVSRICPISFACIPFVGGYPVDQYTQNDWNALDEWWKKHQTCDIYDIAENVELVVLLRKWVCDGRATIMLHGIHHRLFEFSSNQDLTHEIRLARQHLSKLFHCSINLATPPNNTLSKSSTLALAKNNMNILVAYGHTPRERPISLSGLWSFARLFGFFLRHGKRLRYPYPLTFSSHKEQACYHLGPGDSYLELERGLKYSFQTGGNFVVGTHFYHLLENIDLQNILHQLLEKAQALAGDKKCFVRAEQLFI